jgi:hypothetical protein
MVYEAQRFGTTDPLPSMRAMEDILVGGAEDLFAHENMPNARRDFEYAYCPVMLGGHYGSAIYQRDAPAIEYFDPMETPLQPAMITRLQNWVLEIMPAGTAPPRVDQIPLTLNRHNRQPDSHRCGFFAATMFLRHATHSGSTYIPNVRANWQAQQLEEYIHRIIGSLLEPIYPEFEDFVGQLVVSSFAF